MRVSWTLAGSATVMLLARLVAGAGAAMIMPVTLSVVTSSFPEDHANAVGVGRLRRCRRHPRAVLLGRDGRLVQLALVVRDADLALRRRPGAHHPQRRELARGARAQLDVLGGVLSAVAIGGLVLAFHEGSRARLDQSLTVLGLVAGIAGTVAFVMWELRHPRRCSTCACSATVHWRAAR
ncbi:MAG: hypothetical protein R2713_02860 [Ilumatobacteraceae bacterium]